MTICFRINFVLKNYLQQNHWMPSHLPTPVPHHYIMRRGRDQYWLKYWSVQSYFRKHLNYFQSDGIETESIWLGDKHLTTRQHMYFMCVRACVCCIITCVHYVCVTNFQICLDKFVMLQTASA